ncbi:dolichyl-phosphate-mannose--protein mannosyltransferase [Caerostris extrusa]|uniref:Dolichyl-phosphate-mannose--protein mannosyltransferase n=1 Tax=Caerostris extrusa TaxID=172846 RepID=A0AAV4VRQ7_CAEEX|nr:dolichyl-phosphate-mannose--protein mannosyltransferase [Caerostris extrusa]
MRRDRAGGKSRETLLKNGIFLGKLEQPPDMKGPFSNEFLYQDQTINGDILEGLHAAIKAKWPGLLSSAALGVVFLEQRKTDLAMTSFDKALKINPRHEQALLNSAILIQEGGPHKRKTAYNRLQMLLEGKDVNERVYFHLGMLAMDEKNITLAEKWFGKQWREIPASDTLVNASTMTDVYWSSNAWREKEVPDFYSWVAIYLIHGICLFLAEILNKVTKGGKLYRTGLSGRTVTKTKEGVI